ncbi:MAG: hypothetical protein AB7F64_00950 [Gammaproteobacteria bacterium]
MIIGNGMIAKKFDSYQQSNNTVIFASGISNSQETDFNEFSREKSLLLETLHAYPTHTFVYFSTCSIFDPSLSDSLYVKHKLIMEDLISSHANNYHIFRASQIIGISDNEHMLANFLFHKINHSLPFEVWSHSTRNFIDIDHLYLISDKIIQSDLYKNQIINIANSYSLTMKEIITLFETVIGKKAICEYIPKGASYAHIDLKPILPILNELKIEFDNNYYQRVIQKYSPYFLTKA